MRLTLRALAVLAACVLAAQTATAQRQLGMAVVPQQRPFATGNQIVKAFDLAQAAGCTVVQVGWTWSSLEPAPGSFHLTELTNTLAYLRARGFSIILNIQVLNTNIKETPSDLLAVSFDDPSMKTRFHALMDAVQPYLGADIKSLSVGNEVDAFLRATPWEWDPYKRFYADAVAYIHGIAPGIPVGVTVTYDGAQQSSSDVSQLNQPSDVWVFTYYPLNPDFTPRDPADPLAAFPNMLFLAGGKPVVLQEVGYPSAGLLHSSQQLQAQFVQHVFEAWATAGNQIPVLSYFALHDFTRKQTYQFTLYYGFGSAKFRAFLGTLGLRTAWGAPKPAWDVFVRGAAALGP